MEYAQFLHAVGACRGPHSSIALSRPGRRSGFTLIELLVVLAIIGVLIGILVPVLSAARSVLVTARSRCGRAACSSTAPRAGLAMRGYLDANNDTFPFASFMPSVGAFPIMDGDPVNIVDVLLPYASGDTKAFRCPMDEGQIDRSAPHGRKPYFETEKTSYEYRSHLLGGQTMKTAIERIRDFTGETRQENSIWIFRDYDNFHGTGGNEGARRYVYNDGHVTDFE